MKRSHLPSFDDLRAFETVARLGSVRAAAGELALTHGAVSRRISKLAMDLGLRLVEPEGRGLRLTQHGEALARAMTTSVALVSSALEAIRASTPVRAIVLSCERSVAMRWLIPRLSTFQDRHPEIEVHLSVGGGALDAVRDRATLAIRRLDFPVGSDWTVTRLMDEEVGPVMRPAMAERFQSGDYVALGARTRPDAWRRWADANPDAPVPRTTRLLDHHFLIGEAAANGLGVAMCPRLVAMDDVSTHRLVAPLGFTPDGSRYGLLQPARGAETPEVASLKAWLIALAAEIAGPSAAPLPPSAPPRPGG